MSKETRAVMFKDVGSELVSLRNFKVVSCRSMYNPGFGKVVQQVLLLSK